ncbi:MAG TPA: RedB protein [Candidatus Binatia bacterium]|jgi:hypothetical protein|nr:RedB protein [Candidatus Binatia bacterium]
MLEAASSITPRIRRWITAFGFIAWSFAVGLGLLTLTAYDTAPGAAALSPHAWPTDSRLARADDRATLVLMLHPHCPCSRASVDELASLLPELGDHVTTHVLLVAPQGTSAAWADTDLRARVEALPDVQVTVDTGASEASRFGAVTSGQAYLFDADGTLRFNGGLTPARGHRGDSPARSALLAAVTPDRGAPEATTPVYGCALTGATAPPGMRDAWRSAIEAVRRRWYGDLHA